MTMPWNPRKTLLPFVLALQSVYCWFWFYKAQFFSYDDNYGALIHSFLISLAALFMLITLWWRKRQWVREAALSTIIWLLAGSPLTFILAAFNYEVIFGVALAN